MKVENENKKNGRPWANSKTLIAYTNVWHSGLFMQQFTKRISNSQLPALENYAKRVYQSYQHFKTNNGCSPVSGNYSNRQSTSELQNFILKSTILSRTAINCITNNAGAIRAMMRQCREKSVR